MQREEWINEVLNSSKGIAKAEAPAFLYEKICAKIEARKQSTPALSEPIAKWAFAFATIVFIAINILSLKKHISAEETKMVSEQKSEFDQSVIYNY